MSISNKIPQITILFWVLKIIATTLGETLGDYFSMTLNLGYLKGLEISLGFLIVAVSLEILNKKFNLLLFWTAVISTTTFGTEISDLMDRTMGLGYAMGSAILFLLFAASLAAWKMKYGNVKVYPITSRWKEIFFWTAVLFSNSLGTAFGDFLSDNLGLGFLYGAIITAGIIGLLLLLHYSTRINDVILFWIAFVFTRPFGATFGDLLTKPVEKGGLSLSRGSSALTCAGLMLLLMWIEVRQKWKITLNTNGRDN